eukprot:6196427-Pleurochrysis_carterae.AAC.1
MADSMFPEGTLMAGAKANDFDPDISIAPPNRDPLQASTCAPHAHLPPSLLVEFSPCELRAHADGFSLIVPRPQVRTPGAVPEHNESYVRIAVCA